MSSSGPSLPTLSSAQVREADALAADRFGVPTAWLMEAAGWQCARHCLGATTVIAGSGNNGGDALAAARHLHRWGRLRGVACLDRSRLRGEAAARAEALEKLGIQIAGDLDLDGAEVLLDGIFGTGLSRDLDGKAAAWVRAINESGLPVVSVDVPSGLDADTGEVRGAAVVAAQTVTLGLPKPGLLEGSGPALAGEIWLADIGVPFEVYAAVGAAPPPGLFSAGDRLRYEAVAR